MEISGKVLREVEFRDRLRGYDTDEVDDFLEKVAIGVDALNAHLAELEARLAQRPLAPQAPLPPAPATAQRERADDDTISRTLVLAQRTADLAIAEAREEASQVLADARAEADTLRGRAEEEAHARLDRLSDERDRLEREARSLARLVADERARLTESLTAALAQVREHVRVGDELEQLRSEREQEAPMAPRRAPGPEHDADEAASGPSLFEGDFGGEAATASDASSAPSHDEVAIPDVEAEIADDAESARSASAFMPEPGGGHVGPPRPVGGRSGGDEDEALWERWAAGRDLGVVPGPSDFTPTSERRDPPGSGWSA